MKSKRLKYRKLTQDDAEEYIKLIGNEDSELREYAVGFILRKKQEFQDLLETFERRESPILGIFEKKENNLIGAIVMDRGFCEKGEAEVSFFIGKKYRGQHYASEALATVVQDISYKDISKLYFEVANSNEFSRRIVEGKLGAKYEHDYEEDEKIYSLDIVTRKQAVLVESDLTRAICAFHDCDDKERRESYVREYTLEFCKRNNISVENALKIVESYIDDRRKHSGYKYEHYRKLKDIVCPKVKKKKNDRSYEDD